MKKFRIVKEIEAEKMSQADAEEALGKKIDNVAYSTDGYLMCEGGDISWVPKEKVKKLIHPYDSTLDIIRYMIDSAKEQDKWLVNYLKTDRSVSLAERDRLYVCIRRIKVFRQDMEKLLKLNILKL